MELFYILFIELMKNCQLAISSLSWTTTKQELQELFSNFGKVMDVTLIKNPLGESIGDAYITMSEKMDVKNAVENLNGKVVDGKNIIVKKISRYDASRNKALLASA
jgi:RNA recognition motif-containing protein